MRQRKPRQGSSIRDFSKRRMEPLSTCMIAGRYMFLEETNRVRKGSAGLALTSGCDWVVSLPKWCFLMGQRLSVRDLSTTSDRKSTLTGLPGKGKILAHESAKLRSRFQHQVQLDSGFKWCLQALFFSSAIAQCCFHSHPGSPTAPGWPWECQRLPSSPEANSAPLHPSIPSRCPEIHCHWPVLGPMLMGSYGLSPAPGGITNRFYSKYSISTTGDQALELNCLISNPSLPAVWPGAGAIIS